MATVVAIADWGVAGVDCGGDGVAVAVGERDNVVVVVGNGVADGLDAGGGVVGTFGCRAVMGEFGERAAVGAASGLEGASEEVDLVEPDSGS